jgi:hypothetical protein
MSFSLANPSGWTTGDQLTPAQINQLDTEHAAAIDGTNGGTYTLVAPLVINGDLVTISELTVPNITGDTDFSNDIDVANDIHSGHSITADHSIVATHELVAGTNIIAVGNLTVNGISTLDATSIVGLSASGTTAFTGVTTFSNNVAFTNPVTYSNSVTFSQTVNCNSDVNLGNGTSDTITIAGKATFNTPVTMGSGGYIKRRVSTGGDADATYSPDTFEEVHVINALLTADRIYTIGDSSLENGASISFSSDDVTNSITVKNPAATTLAVINASGGGGTYQWCEFRKISGTWRATKHS